jgi:hypothetical protein
LTRRSACCNSTRLQWPISRQTGANDADELTHTALDHYGIGLEDMRTTLASANANSPKGTIERAGTPVQLSMQCL